MLGNFTYHNPTKLHFGDDALKFLPDEAKCYGENILLVYGGGSIKKFGLYDEVVKILKDCNKNIFDLSGVMPNPTYEKVLEGCKAIRDNNIDLILAVGGGSVVDYCKAISASAYCEGDAWEKYYLKGEPVNNKVIPLGSILTMVGTGSEMNGGSVITNTDTKTKNGRVFDVNVYPKFSILNPKLTYTLPKYQMVAGFFDIFSHILEQYLSGDDDCTSDYVMEGLLKSLINSAKIAVKNPEDYEARSNIMWTSTWALNGFVGKGKPGDWMVHMMGHQISSYTDATHGMTLAAVSIPYYKLILKEGLHKFKRFAINVWNVCPDGKTDEEIALEGLDNLKQFMHDIELVTSLKELGVTEDMISEIANTVIILPNGFKKLTVNDIEKIFKEAL